MTGSSPPPHQGQVFAAGEGNAWFARNREHLLAFNREEDLPLRLLRLFQVRPRRTLEIGCSNGARLNALKQEFGAQVVGVDLSEEATQDGRARYGLDLRVQAAHKVNVAGPFDLVIVHFVLHWIDRSELDEVIQCIDQQVASGGLLLIGDFCPDRPTRVRYHHLEADELWTYKENYPTRFLDLGKYVQVGQLTGDHREFTPCTGVESAERIGNWLLEKRG